MFQTPFLKLCLEKVTLIVLKSHKESLFEVNPDAFSPYALLFTNFRTLNLLKFKNFYLTGNSLILKPTEGIIF